MVAPPWYFKEIPLDNLNEIIQEVRDAFPTVYPEFDINEINYTIFKSSVDTDLFKECCPILSQLLKDWKLYDSWNVTNIFVKHVGNDINPHIDRPATPTRGPRVFSLNFPIYNCEFSKTNWYAFPKDESMEIRQIFEDKMTATGIFQHVPMEKWELIDSLTVTQATAMRIDYVHGIEMPKEMMPGMIGKGARVALCIRFDPEPFEFFGHEPNVWFDPTKI